jgi:ubiquinone/menaquinone biosynthesis C-methylase UbiE
MPDKPIIDRLRQVAAFAIVAIFVLGFVFPAIGVWTGAILAAWFVGTQKPVTGFVLLAGIAFLTHVFQNWKASGLPGVEYAGWMGAAALLSALPYLFYRLTDERREGFLATLSLPLWGVVFQTLGNRWIPAALFSRVSLGCGQNPKAPLAHLVAVVGPDATYFLVYGTAALIVWIWNFEFEFKKVASGAAAFIALLGLVFACNFLLQAAQASAGRVRARQPAMEWACLVGAVAVTTVAFVKPSRRRKAWVGRTETVALLRSPYTAEPLHVAVANGREELVSGSGEAFPIRDGIPVFVKADEITGSNLKYNRLYEIIAGFYDDTQRVACALMGMNRREHFMAYMRFVEARPGDLVLETSVGTGLNYKYLPRGVTLFGLDLSLGMLEYCQANLRRWEMDADLFQGNAETLPFADESFDVVYHSGGINFFNDRAKAIREMIRVAKPGSRILIADETEKHVQDAYEKFPVTGRFFKNRKETVTVPVDLVPPEMQETHVEILWGGRFYALTFRKPAYSDMQPSPQESV